MSEIHPKSENFPNVSQIQPSLPTSQSFKYCKYQIKHTQFIIIIYIYSKFIPKFNLLIISQSLKYCKNPKINPKFSQMHQKYIPNVSQIQPSLPTSQSFKYCKYQIKHTQFIIIIYIYSKFIPKFNLLIISQSLKYCKNPKIIPNFPKCIRNASQIYPKIQPSLPTSQSFKYCKYQIKHTQFIIIIYIYSKFIPKFNLLPISQSLKYCKNPKINPKFSQMHQKYIPNVSQIQLLFLHLSHSNTVNIKSSIHSSS